MKSTTTLIAIILGFTILLPACSIEKRRYNKGFHVNKNGGKKMQSDQTINSRIDPIPDEVVIVAEDFKAIDEEYSDASIIEVDDALVEDSKPEFERASNTPARKTIESSKISNTFRKNQNAKIEKKVSKKLKKKNNSSDDGNDDSGVLAGALVMALGIALLLFVSLLVGLIVLLVGLIILIVGASKTNNKPEEKKPLEDVVYLKNGSVIRGTIIEQIPNVSIKIQTSGGSIFFYKMEEVEKMTKEPSR